MLDRLRRKAWGLSGRLTASYILVTLAVVALVETLALGFQVPSLVNGAQLQAEVAAAAQSYAAQLTQRYPAGVPAGTVLGAPGQPAQPGLARTTLDGTLVVPAIAGRVHSDQAVTAVVAIAADGTVVASSAPSRYPPGTAAASELPGPAVAAIAYGAISSSKPNSRGSRCSRTYRDHMPELPAVWNRSRIRSITSYRNVPVPQAGSSSSTRGAVSVRVCPPSLRSYVIVERSANPSRSPKSRFKSASTERTMYETTGSGV